MQLNIIEEKAPFKFNDIRFDDITESILFELEKTKENFWNLDRDSANFLNLLIKINKSKNVLEIGTSNGYSGIWILKALKELNNNGALTTIEYWEKRQRIARENFSKCVPDIKVIARIGSAFMVLEDLLDDIKKGKIEKFDFIFIDANKREYIEYFSYVDKILDNNGIILADNILSHATKVQNYVELLQNHKNYQSQIINIGAGMMLSRKNI